MPTAHAEILSLLGPDESLKWLGKPSRPVFSLWAAYFTSIATVFLIFSIGVFLICAVMVLTRGEFLIGKPTDFIVVLLFLLGMWMLSIVPIIGSLAVCKLAVRKLIGPSKETYVLTNKRGLIVSRFLEDKIVSLSPETLSNFSKRGDKRIASLHFRVGPSTILSFYKRHFFSDLSAFRNIRNPKEVERLILSTFSKKD